MFAHIITLDAGPIRPFEASDNAGLREIAKSSSAKLTPSQPLRLSDEGLARYDDIPRRSTTPFSVESRPVHSGTMDDSAAHNTPSHVGQLGVEDIEELSEHRPDTPVGIACALPERPEPSVCKTDGAAVAYRVKRHLSADFVPSSQEGEEDSSPSSALRPAPAYKRIDVDCEIVPASQNTSTIASSSTSIPVKPKKDKQPAPLGLTHTYTIKRGRPKALLTCTASRVQQRPTYP